MWIELAREKQASGLQDLVRPAQLEHLSPQLPDLFPLLARGQIRPSPSFASTCRTYFRNVSDGSPRSAATCAIGRPDSNTNRVARSNSSTGYFLALGMTDHSFHQEHPGIEVSVKPGMAHRAPDSVNVNWVTDLNRPAGMIPVDELLPWWTRCLNELFTEMTDLGRYATPDGLFDARRAYQASRTLDRVFVNCARIQVHTDDHVGRVSSAFELLDLFDSIVDRELTPRTIYKTLLSPTRARMILEESFAGVPDATRDVLMNRVGAVLDMLRTETLDHVLADRLRDEAVLVGTEQPMPMGVDEYIGRLFQAMRDTHHGYHLNAAWKRQILDTNTGHISVAFPELLVLYVLALVSDPQNAIDGRWFDGELNEVA